MNANLNFKNKEIIYQLLLIMIIVFLYSFSWNYPIYDSWDDTVYILKNNHLAFSFSNILWWFTHSCVGCYLPLTMLSYMFDYNIWGLNSFGYHLQNIFWHTIATLAIYKCFRLFNIKSWIAFFLCMIFAVHPQRVESVVWLSERKDVLCAAFYFLCIYFYIKNHNKKFSTTAFIFFILAMLSKPMAVSLPLILLVYEFYRYGKGRLETVGCRDTRRVSETCNAHVAVTVRHAPRVSTDKINRLPRLSSTSRRTKAGDFIRLWPYFIILLIFIPLAIITQGEAVNSPTQVLLSHQLYIILYNTYWYFTQTIFCTDLNPIYPPIQPLCFIIEISLFYAGFLLIAVTMYCKNKKLFIYATLPLALVYLISLLPVVGLIKLGFIDRADRYSYISSVFIWFSIGLILTRLLYDNNETSNQLKKSFILRKQFIFVILFLYSAILIESNYQYQKIWKSKYCIFLYAADSVPANYTALRFLADLEMEQSNYVRVLEIADQLEHQNKGSLIALFYKTTVLYYLDKKTAIKKLSYLRPYYKAIAYKNKDTGFRYLKILNMLIDSNDSIGNTQKIVQYINEMLQFKQLNEFNQFFYKGIKAYFQKNYSRAIYWFNKALVLEPNNKIIKENIQLCLEAQKEKRKNLLSTNLIN